MSDKTDRRWRNANELMAFGLVAILLSGAVTVLAVARRTGVEPLVIPFDGEISVTLRGAAVVIGATLAAGAATYVAQLTKERRAAKRYDCRLPCEVNLHGAVLRSRMVNISENGAQIRTKGFRLREGDAVRIRTANVAQDATIVWADGGRVGMRFAHRLSYDEFRAILARARKRGSLAVRGASDPNVPRGEKPDRDS